MAEQVAGSGRYWDFEECCWRESAAADRVLVPAQAQAGARVADDDEVPVAPV